MWFFALLVNLSWPLIVLGLPVLAYGLIGHFTAKEKRFEASFPSDHWLVWNKRVKTRGAVMVLGAAMMATGFAMPDIDFTTRTVTVEKVVIQKTKFKELYDECNNRMRYDQNHRYPDAEIQSTCIASAKTLIEAERSVTP